MRCISSPSTAPVVAFLSTAALLVAAFCASAEKSAPRGASAAAPPHSASRIHPVNTDALPRLLASRGVVPPDSFKALLIEIVERDDGTYDYYPMDFAGTSMDRDNWWPASTVKLYAATAALEKLRFMGFDPLKTEVTYDYETTETYKDGPVTERFEQTLRRAITDSKNPDFDRLVDIVGAARLNRHFLVPKHGIRNTVMLRCYSGRTPDPETGKCSNRVSPSITIAQGSRTQTLPVRRYTESLPCENEGNCTTLADLTEVLRRVMMHESLPESERFRLGETELKLLRSALKGTHARGGVADGIRLAFQGRPVEMFHKAGYADQWFSDNLFLKILDTHEQWIIGMVGRPGRGALDSIARDIAGFIADGTLSAVRRIAFQGVRTQTGRIVVRPAATETAATP